MTITFPCGAGAQPAASPSLHLPGNTTDPQNMQPQDVQGIFDVRVSECTRLSGSASKVPTNVQQAVSQHPNNSQQLGNPGFGGYASGVNGNFSQSRQHTYRV